MTNKKRVAVVYHYIAHYRLYIFKELAKSDIFSFDFISDTNTDIDIKILDHDDFFLNGLETIKVKNIWFFKKKFLWQSGLLRILYLKKYDHVIFLGNPNFISTWVSLFFLYFLKTKTYLWAHGYTKKCGGAKSFILFFFWGLVDNIFLYGNFAKNEMVKMGVNENRLKVIYNSLDYPNHIELRKNLKKSNILSSYFKNDDPILVFIGRLTKVKKLDYLILAHQHLLKQNYNCNLLIIGSGIEMNFLKEMASPNIDRVWFFGECYDETVISELIYNSSVCVSPGNVGLTAIHSLSFGTPVITHSNFNDQMPEYEAIHEGVTGAFFRQDDLHSLVEKLMDWLYKKTVMPEITTNCYNVIDRYYNPIYQKEIILENLIRNC